MEQLLARYYELKQAEKQLQEEIESLRKEILALHPEPGKVEAGDYLLQVTVQEKREYDDQKLYQSLPDHDFWRLVSRADNTKINAMLKAQILREEWLNNTYETRQTLAIRVQKR